MALSHLSPPHTIHQVFHGIIPSVSQLRKIADDVIIPYDYFQTRCASIKLPFYNGHTRKQEKQFTVT